MAHDDDKRNGTFPLATGSLERAVETEDERLVDRLTEPEVEEPAADDDPTELDRMLIRMGGNGF